mmetsp:Transcript_20780/g.27343  ORF Transcript_20780/g.27343 Transcript_20780/m.27343 type:complete len:89 (-) Transcript_20780:271-537(-)
MVELSTQKSFIWSHVQHRFVSFMVQHAIHWLGDTFSEIKIYEYQQRDKHVMINSTTSYHNIFRHLSTFKLIRRNEEMELTNHLEIFRS